MSFVYPLCSSSTGNSVYIGDKERGILVDAGISKRALVQAFKLQDIPTSAIKAIFVTHEHSDHIKGLLPILQMTKAPIYASSDTLVYLQSNNSLPADILAREMEGGLAEIEGISVRGYYTPHDSVSSMCYRFWTADNKSGVICTDLGHIPTELVENFHGADLVMLESNYDENLLLSGGYPVFLKRRILSRTGHLSNEICALALTDLFNNGTTRFILGHLSKENNRPEIAFSKALSELTKTGGELAIDFSLAVAPRCTTGEVVSF